jgi:hypothetical protein
VTRRSPIAAVIAAVIATLVVLGGCAAPDQWTTRQSEVAERGQEVMPFDLEATTHRFLPTDDGLREEVTADQPGDTGQVTLIRQHLAEEATRFRAGDYGDPASIHGQAMPGLADLAGGADRIDITYTDLPAGAALTFHTTDPDLVRALHTWGEAQTSDHGAHATS